MSEQRKDFPLWNFCPYCGSEFDWSRDKPDRTPNELVCGQCGCGWQDYSVVDLRTRIADLEQRLETAETCMNKSQAFSAAAKDALIAIIDRMGHVRTDGQPGQVGTPVPDELIAALETASTLLSDAPELPDLEAARKFAETWSATESDTDNPAANAILDEATHRFLKSIGGKT